MAQTDHGEEGRASCATKRLRSSFIFAMGLRVRQTKCHTQLDGWTT